MKLLFIKLLYVFYIMSAASAAYAQHRADTNVSADMASVAEPPSTLGATAISVAEKLIARVGPIGYFGIENNTTKPLNAIPRALICSMSQTDKQSEWLFAVPLWGGAPTVQISPGINVVALAVQGFNVQSLKSSRVSDHHFNYIAEMTSSRMLRLSDQIENQSMRNSAVAATLSFIEAIYEASDDEFAELIPPTTSNYIFCNLSMTISIGIDQSSTVAVAIDPLSAAYWLANYRTTNDPDRLASLRLIIGGIRN